MAEPKGGSYLGVDFTPEEEAKALAFLKNASLEELSSLALSDTTVKSIQEKSPFSDLESFSAQDFIKKEDLVALKTHVLSEPSEKVSPESKPVTKIDEPLVPETTEKEESLPSENSVSANIVPPKEGISANIVPPEELVQGSSLWKDAWQRLLKNKMAVGCGLVFFSVVLFCLAGWLIPTDPRVQNIDLGAMGPSAAHWFGTDSLGRDMMARVMEGGRISLAVGLISTLVSVFVGVLYGATAGYVGGWVDNLMMRIVDVMFSLPFMFIVILIITVLPEEYKTGEASVYILFLVLGLVQWLVMARIVRGQVLSLKNREFVEAARAIGVRAPKIIFRHLIPNTLGPIIVYSTLTIPAVMLEEAFLSFIGLGVQAPKASWGTLLSEGAKSMIVYPWLLIFPALFMSLTLFSLNFLGDGLRDALDPQLRKD